MRAERARDERLGAIGITGSYRRVGELTSEEACCGLVQRRHRSPRTTEGAQVKTLKFNEVESQARVAELESTGELRSKKIWSRTLYYWRPRTATPSPSSNDRRLPK